MNYVSLVVYTIYTKKRKLENISCEPISHWACLRFSGWVWQAEGGGGPTGRIRQDRWTYFLWMASGNTEKEAWEKGNGALDIPQGPHTPVSISRTTLFIIHLARCTHLFLFWYVKYRISYKNLSRKIWFSN